MSYAAKRQTRTVRSSSPNGRHYTCHHTDPLPIDLVVFPVPSLRGLLPPSVRVTSTRPPPPQSSPERKTQHHQQAEKRQVEDRADLVHVVRTLGGQAHLPLRGLDAGPRPSRRLVAQRRDAAVQIRLEVVDLLGCGAVRQAGVRLERDVPAPVLQLLGRHAAPGVAHDGVGVAVAHEDRGGLVGAVGGDEVAQLALQQQVAAQAEDAAEAVGRGDAGQQAHRAALREAAEDDARGGDARVDLSLDQRVEDLARAQDARLVVRAVREVREVGDVVPPGHAHAHVDRDRDARRVREDELGLGELVLAAELLGEEVPVGKGRMGVSKGRERWRGFWGRRGGVYQPAPLPWFVSFFCCRLGFLFAGTGCRIYLSPSPCATITVEVCRFSAGTTMAAALDMVTGLCSMYRFKMSEG
nr:hypothetical protein CFP56_07438 [Quercus suber]